MIEPGNGEKRKQAESLLYDLHEIAWDDAVSLLMRILARAEAAEKALHELTEPISDAGHTTADGLRHELQQARARAEAAEKREAELREEVREAIIKLSSKMRGTWLEYTIHAFRKIIADVEAKP